VVLTSARTSFFIDHIVGFGFVNTMAEADWCSGSARHSVSFANQKPGPLNPFLSDNSCAFLFPIAVRLVLPDPGEAGPFLLRVGIALAEAS
jgi:hypothetical protein